MKRRLWVYAACVAFYPVVQFLAARIGDRIRRHRAQSRGPFPTVIPITNRRNPA